MRICCTLYSRSCLSFHGQTCQETSAPPRISSMSAGSAFASSGAFASISSRRAPLPPPITQRPWARCLYANPFSYPDHRRPAELNADRKPQVVGAPSFFKSIWDVISQWFDPVTRSKIFLLSASEAHEVMRTYIDRANLPVEYGGDLDWTWQDLPNLDSHARRLVDNLYEKTDQGEIFAKGPVTFENGCIKLLGTVNGHPRRNDYCPR